MTEIPVIPENAPFQPEQRVWLNGFLAGYFCRLTAPASTAPAAAASAKPSLLILFGSQTGTSERLARRLGKVASARGFGPRVCDAADHGRIDWPSERTLLVITSTYGDGEMPDNAQGFWDWLQTDKAATTLAHLHYAVLALGDRNYPAFCAAGKSIDQRLEHLGAQRFFNRVDCDVDYEGEAGVWIEGVLTAAAKLWVPEETPSRVMGAATTQVERSAAKADAVAAFSKTNPFPARCLTNFCLNQSGSAKEVRHVELDLRDSGLAYEPGDALGICARNCPGLVQQVLDALGASGEEVVNIDQTEISLREALRCRLDITKPSPRLLGEIARRVPECDLAGLLVSERKLELKQWLWGRDVVDALRLLPGRLSWSEWVPLLNKLAPRLYSISSSPRAHQGEVHLTVSALRYESHGRSRKGVASTYLADHLPPGEAVPLFIQPARGFKLPAADLPIIMVGPGTGIAPFRAFLEERQTTGARGRNWLFFGEQKRACDFLYQEQLSRWQQDGHLTRFEAAFSRDQLEKVYVQHLMLEQAAELWAWLQAGAYFYVCGDANRMARDVDLALHQVAERAGGLSADGAKQFIQELKAARRYQRDVY